MPEPYKIDRFLYESSAEVINELQKLLLFHVVAGRVSEEDLDNEQSYVTFLGSFADLVKGLGSVTILKQGGETYVKSEGSKGKIVKSNGNSPA